MPRARRNNPKVFISYTYDSPSHKAWVRSLADKLCNDGIDCNIDQYLESPPEGWPQWMINQIQEADHVIVVCTATYRRRAEQKEKPGKGRGATWEGGVITLSLYDTNFANTMFLPVVRDAEDVGNIPIILSGATHYDLSSEAGYEALYRRLTRQPAVRRPAVGAVRVLPPEPAPEEPHAAEPDVVESPDQPAPPSPRRLIQDLLGIPTPRPAATTAPPQAPPAPPGFPVRPDQPPPKVFNPIGVWNVEVFSLLPSTMLMTLNAVGCMGTTQAAAGCVNQFEGAWVFNALTNILVLQLMMTHFLPLPGRQPVIIQFQVLGWRGDGFAAIRNDGASCIFRPG